MSRQLQKDCYQLCSHLQWRQESQMRLLVFIPLVFLQILCYFQGEKISTMSRSSQKTLTPADVGLAAQL